MNRSYRFPSGRKFINNRHIKVAIQNEDGIINEYFEVGEFEVIGAPQKQKQSKEEEQYEKELRKLEEWNRLSVLQKRFTESKYAELEAAN